MKLNEYLKAFYEFSAKASDVTRNLGFAGIAVIWVFKTGDATQPNVPKDLVLPGFLIVLGLSCDLLQYISASAIWSLYYSKKRREGLRADDEVQAPGWLNKPIYFFFCAKILLVAAGYVSLLRYLFARWW
jgi:hypothetical protein